MAGIWETLFGSGDKFSKQSTLDPSQQQFLQQMLSQLGGGGGVGQNFGQANDFLSRILSNDPSTIAQFEAPYRQQFEQQTLPGIAERFAGANPMGGGLSSSGFGQALGGAGAQLQAQLAGLRGQHQQGASQQAMNQYNQLGQLGLGTRSFENVFQPGSGGLLGGALSGLGSGLGMGMGLGMGGGIGGMGMGGIFDRLKKFLGMG